MVGSPQKRRNETLSATIAGSDLIVFSIHAYSSFTDFLFLLLTISMSSLLTSFQMFLSNG
uniref:Uncharacterized protein n=1 Tax=Arundo donax TaxID=35708 RepID=A0A0A9DWR4_ARUDO